MRATKLARVAKPVALVGGGVFLLMQLVPYGWEHPNPPVLDDAPWPTASAERLARAACYDCHSNETDWPVHSYVAPMSWLVRQDVERGREALNFSLWARFDGEADDAVEEVAEGSMPPPRYRLIHPEADLSDDEVRELIAALEQMDDRDDDTGDEDSSGPG